MPVVPRELDQHHHLLNLQNGTLDLTTGVLFPHDPRLLVTKLAPVTFDPTAQAPEWLKFVNAVFANDADLISYVQRVVGYALGGWVTAQMLVFFYGLGSNGKTTFLETIAGLLGDYAAPAAPGLLLEKKHESHPTEIADLQGRRLVISMEVDVAQKLSEALVKQLTGGDTLKARFMGGDFFEFEPTHKLFLAANHKPIIHGNDLGIWRRIKLIPFGVSFTGAQQDLNLKAKLMAELSGILNWLLQGCLDFQRYGFATSKAVDDATSAYREESDRLAGFLADCCMKGPECERSSVLYQAYLTWCTQNGETPVQQRTFGTMLRERGFEPTKLHGNAGWKGLRVVTEIRTSHPCAPRGGGWGGRSGSFNERALYGPTWKFLPFLPRCNRLQSIPALARHHAPRAQPDGQPGLLGDPPVPLRLVGPTTPRADRPPLARRTAASTRRRVPTCSIRLDAERRCLPRSAGERGGRLWRRRPPAGVGR